MLKTRLEFVKIGVNGTRSDIVFIPPPNIAMPKWWQDDQEIWIDLEGDAIVIHEVKNEDSDNRIVRKA